jgi:hypothetical protein
MCLNPTVTSVAEVEYLAVPYLVAVLDHQEVAQVSLELAQKLVLDHQGRPLQQERPCP